MMTLEPAEPTISASKRAFSCSSLLPVVIADFEQTVPSSSQSADQQVPSQPTEKHPAQRQGDVRRIYSIIVTALSNVVHAALVMWKKVHRVAMLLTTGYNSLASQRKRVTLRISSRSADLLAILLNAGMSNPRIGISFDRHSF